MSTTERGESECLLASRNRIHKARIVSLGMSHCGNTGLDVFSEEHDREKPRCALCFDEEVEA